MEKLVNPSASDSFTPKPVENPLPPVNIPFPHEQEAPITNEPNNNQGPTLHRGTRTRKEAGFYNENQLQKAGESAHIATVDDEVLDSGEAEHALYAGNQDWFAKLIEEALTTNPEDTPSVQEALDGPEKEKWLEAMHEELKQITKVETFTIVETPHNTNVIDRKWVLR